LRRAHLQTATDALARALLCLKKKRIRKPAALGQINNKGTLPANSRERKNGTREKTFLFYSWIHGFQIFLN
jgi:hypothetical protein